MKYKFARLQEIQRFATVNVRVRSFRGFWKPQL